MIFEMKLIIKNENTLNDVKNNQKINKGCMFLVMSPFIFVALVLSFAVFNTLYYVFFPKKNPYPSTTSIRYSPMSCSGLIQQDTFLREY